eukprot:SAG31_NODE_6588_length_1961_cov_2.769603_3_plen_46_part_01
MGASYFSQTNTPCPGKLTCAVPTHEGPTYPLVGSDISPAMVTDQAL